MEFVDLIQERDRTNCHGILYPQAGNGRLWGNDRRTKGDVGKVKLFERGTNCREKKRDKLLSIFRLLAVNFWIVERAREKAEK